jgi:hypothetical protein
VYFDHSAFHCIPVFSALGTFYWAFVWYRRGLIAINIYSWILLFLNVLYSINLEPDALSSCMLFHDVIFIPPLPIMFDVACVWSCSQCQIVSQFEVIPCGSLLRMKCFYYNNCYLSRHEVYLNFGNIFIILLVWVKWLTNSQPYIKLKSY